MAGGERRRRQWATESCVLGFGYLKTQGNESFLEQWIDRFIEGNPKLFGRKE